LVEGVEQVGDPFLVLEALWDGGRDLGKILHPLPFVPSNTLHQPISGQYLLHKLDASKRSQDRSA
jgi:hypothetical protein